MAKVVNVDRTNSVACGLVLRQIRTKFEGVCRKCRRRIGIGETVYWEQGKGIWHLNCDLTHPAITWSKRSMWGLNDTTFILIGFGLLGGSILTMFVESYLSPSGYVSPVAADLFLGGLGGGVVMLIAVGPLAILGRTCHRCHTHMVKVGTFTRHYRRYTDYYCPTCGWGKRDDFWPPLR